MRFHTDRYIYRSFGLPISIGSAPGRNADARTLSKNSTPLRPYHAKRNLTFMHSTYHQFIARSGDNFVKPDLAVAFNSGCSQEDVQSWKETLVALAKHKVPTVFTVRLQATFLHRFWLTHALLDSGIQPRRGFSRSKATRSRRRGLAPRTRAHKKSLGQSDAQDGA